MPGILSELQESYSADKVTVIGVPAIESEIILTALRDECSSDEEFATLMEACGTEMGLYGVIDDAAIATEAAKRIVINDFKAANFNRITNRTAIRMAMINNDPLYTKYRKYRNLLLETREKIYKKYGPKAKVEARKIIQNARKKASNMPTNGKDIVSKIDKQIEKAEADK